jgi:pyrimidine deaminase RibD-like protein
MFPVYPPDATSEICAVLRWIDTNPNGRWDDMGPLLTVYHRWRDIIRGDPALLDNAGTMHTVPGLSSFGRLFLRKATETTAEGSVSPTGQCEKGSNEPSVVTHNNLQRVGRWTVLRDAPSDRIDSVPRPAAGRFVIALEPPTLDGLAESRGESRYLPREEQLALLWQGRSGEEVLCPSTDGLLLMYRAKEATWLPDGWEMDVFPVGWELPHLERWFEYALEMARMEGRPDIQKDTELGPCYVPLPRGIVMHAHLIVRHLALPDSPNEPRVEMSQAGCLAELRDLRDFFRQALQSPARPVAPASKEQNPLPVGSSSGEQSTEPRLKLAETSSIRVTNRLGKSVPNCPGCGSPPAANGNLDDVCPLCGAWMFHCGIIEHLPLPQGTEPEPASIWQQAATPRWEQLPPSQVREKPGFLLRKAIDHLLEFVCEGSPPNFTDLRGESLTRFEELDRAVWVQAHVLGLQNHLPQRPLRGDCIGKTNLPGSLIPRGFRVYRSHPWRNELVALRELAVQYGLARPVEATSSNDREFMEMAIREARRSVEEKGRVTPKVGAVVVRNGKVLASAHRGELGEGEHAEYTALERKLSNEIVAGATVYTTLEPCTTRNHPKIPCAERLIERRVERVVIGMLDPNPAICGKGERLIRDHGIVVERFSHDLIVQLEELNRDFTRAQKQAAASDPH